MATHVLKQIAIWIGVLLLSYGCKRENPRVIEVETGELIEISFTSALVSGEVMDVGETELDAYGHCWSVSSGPSYDLDQRSQLGRCDTLGTYLSQLTGLVPGTRYYVRSYAKGDGNVVYGKEISFTTQADARPVVVTGEVHDIEYTSATCSGSISDDWDIAITARGLCWGTNPVPTLEGQHSIEQEETASFTSTLSDLTEGEGYYYRAYASNSFGTAYGEEKYFDTRIHAPEISITGESDLTAHEFTVEVEASGLLISQKGICYSLDPGPDIDGIHTSEGASEGTFTTNIQGLLSNTSYYVRPYAINREAIVYGDQIMHTTPPMVFSLWIEPDSLYNGCPEDGNYDSPWCHELYNDNEAVWAEIEGVANSKIEVGWDGIFNAYRLETMDLKPSSKGGWYHDINETQSIVLSFYVLDEDNLSGDEFLDSGSKVLPMSTILDLTNNAPTSRYSGSFTLPWEDALAGGIGLKMTFRFDFNEN